MPGPMLRVTSTAGFVSDSATTDRMKSLVILVVLVVACQASTFKYAPPGKCSYPTWECDCKIIYNCGASPADVPDEEDVEDASNLNADCMKDLAPEEYELRIPGKRWRRGIWKSEEFCKDECYDRMNAFLCLEKGELSDYSGRAICSKLIYRVDPGDSTMSTSPFNNNGGSENCCGIFLQWGPGWCSQKWTKKLGIVGCSADLVLSDSSVAADYKLSFFVSSTDCDAATGTESTDFCDGAQCDGIN